MAAEGDGGARARPNQGGSPAKKKRVGGKHNGHQTPRAKAPVLKEPWRKAAKARQLLAEPAMVALNAFLDEAISIVPQAGLPGSPCLPTLIVTPSELIRHILARMTFFVTESKPGACVFAEIYGGVAQSVVSVNNGLIGVTPTDFDARFYIPRTFNDARDFDRCRCIVEEFLVMKLRRALDSSDSELQQKAPNLVRARYYQKQVVIGGALSLLSVGDPATGKGVDLEFSLNVEGDRKYFDDANSFVIPISLQHLAGLEPVHALCMAPTNFETALCLASNRELLVAQPAQVVNGLALYAHALSDKGLTPADSTNEQQYGSEMVGSFLMTCQGLRQRASDPLRFFKSFIRSHYPSRPLACLAMVAQLMSELSAHGGFEADESEVGSTFVGECAELLSTHLLAAVESVQPEPEGIEAIISIVCFLRSPGNVPAAPAAERSMRVRCEGGRQTRLLRKSENCTAKAAMLCRRAAVFLREHAADMDLSWKRGLVECVCDTFASKGMDCERTLLSGATCMLSTEPATKSTTTPASKSATKPAARAAPVAALISKPKSYAAAALSVHDSRAKDDETITAQVVPARSRSSKFAARPISLHDSVRLVVVATASCVADTVASLALPEELMDLTVKPLPRVSTTCEAVCTVLRKAKLYHLAASIVADKSALPGTAHSKKKPESEAVHVTESKRLNEAQEVSTVEVFEAANADVMSHPCGWTSPTTSTEHPWSAPHSSELAVLKFAPPPPLPAHGVLAGSSTAAATRRRMSVTVEVPLTPPESFWSQEHSQDDSSSLSSPISVVSACKPALRQSFRADESVPSATSCKWSKPLFKFRGLFNAPEAEQPFVQLDQPLFRPVSTERDERYDSDLDSNVDSPGTQTPTSSVSSSTSAAQSAVSDLDLETLVRSMLGGKGSGLHDLPLASKSDKAAKGKDYSMTKDYRWDLADRWATSGLQSFPAPWSIY